MRARGAARTDQRLTALSFWVVGFALSISGCDDKPAPAPAGEPAAAASATTAPVATVKVGDEIVGATSPVAFTQGKVVAVDDDGVTFEFGRPDASTGVHPRRTVPAADAYLISTNNDLAQGDNAVCHVVRRKTQMMPVPTWYPCRVLAIHGNKLRVEDHYGTAYELDPDRVIKPREETRKAIGVFIETELAHRKFDTAFEAAGQPHRPAGWQPTVDARVLIHWVGTSWYSGKVVEVKADKGKVRVDFDGDRWSDRDVAQTELAPEPTDALPVAVDQFVLLRPKKADEIWEHHQVVTVTGDTVEVINRNGKKHKVERKDLLPIVPDP